MSAQPIDPFGRDPHTGCVQKATIVTSDDERSIPEAVL